MLDLGKAVILLSVLGLAYFILSRWYWGYQLYQFSKLNECKDPPHEGSWLDFHTGVLEIIALGQNFRRKTSLEYTNQLFKKHGNTYSTKILGQNIIFTCDHAHINHILSAAFANYVSSPRAHLFEAPAPRGIFATDGQQWRDTRKPYRKHFFNNRLICDFDILEQHTQSFIQNVPENDQAFDIHALFLSLSLDTIFAFAVGKPANALSLDQTTEEKQIVEDLACVKETIARDGVIGPLRYLYGRRAFLNASQRLRNFVEVSAILAVRSAQKGRHSDVKLSSGQQPRYTSVQGLSEETDDVPWIIDQSVSALIAGVDTIAGLLSTTFFLLARNARVMQKLRASIIDNIGHERPPYDQLKQLTYMQQVFNEVLRLFPPVPFNARMANKDTVLPSGGGLDGSSKIAVGKGALVVYSTWASHRLSDAFGEELDAFVPERWEKLCAHPPGFMPFNDGPRACPGRRFALTEASYILTRLVQHFSSVTSYDPRPWRERIGLTLENDNGAMVGLSR